MSESRSHDPNDDPTLSLPPREPAPHPGEAETLAPQPWDGTADAPVQESIGPYRLLRQLGAGGMGEVWVAEQTEPVKRQVALKLIKSGIGSKEIITRFEAERQALALMNHPNIAKILDAGTTLDGQPYFVMELVNGQPLTQYCDEQKLGIEDRLRLFGDICSGVQHAHQKGIVHRDLKPGNIIVGYQDGQAVPKIIDFGLAKAMENTQRLTEQSLMTGIGQILGTLKYMSPEQASLDNVDIDTRSDIYSLGVILYELLTGSTPLDNSSLKGQAALQILEFIRDREPIRPSSKLSGSSLEEVSTITGQRRTDSTRLRRILAGDLDWIVMKALEKDRVRRYESASGFAADIQRYLNSEPVIARPPSLNYRFRKFVRKNRVGVLAAGLVALTLVVGIAGTSWSLLWALQAEATAAKRADEAETARQKEERQRQIALEQANMARTQEAAANRNAQLAEQEKQVAETVRDFLQNKLLRQANVWDQANTSASREQTGSQARYNITVRELLDRAAEEYSPQTIRDKFPNQPVVQSEILDTIGTTYLAVGDTKKSLEILEAALKIREDATGSDNPDVISRRVDLVFSYLQAQKQAAAIRQATIVVEQMLSRLETWIETRDELSTEEAKRAAREEVSQALNNVLYTIEQRFTLQKEGFNTEQFNAVEAAMSALRIGQAIPKTQRLAQLCEQEFGGLDRRTIYAEFVHACAMHGVGQIAAATKIYEKIHAAAEAELAPDDLLLAGVKTLIATTYAAREDWPRVIDLQLRINEIIQQRLGQDHPSAILSIHTLALAYVKNGEYDKALPLAELAYQRSHDQLGPEHPNTYSYRNSIAVCLHYLDKPHEALAILERIYEYEKQTTEDVGDLLGLQNNLAALYRVVGQGHKAISVYEEAIENSLRIKGPKHGTTLMIQQNAIYAYLDAGQFEVAIATMRDVVAIKTQTLGENHPSTVGSVFALIDALEAAEKWPELIDTILSALNPVKSETSIARARLSFALDALRKAYAKVDNPEAALPIIQSSFHEQREKLGSDDPLTLELMSLLGLELRARGEFSQALELTEQLFVLETESFGPMHPTTLARAISLAARRFDNQRPSEACEILETTAQRLADLDFQHESSNLVLTNTIAAYKKAGDSENARRWETIWLNFLLHDENTGLEHAGRLASLGLEQLQRKEWLTSEKLLQRCLDIRQQFQPEHWTTYNTKSMLGASLLGQQRYVEAERLLLEGYEGLDRLQTEIPPGGSTRLAEALDRLIELYMTIEQPARWQHYHDLRHTHSTTDAAQEDQATPPVTTADQ